MVGHTVPSINETQHDEGLKNNVPVQCSWQGRAHNQAQSGALHFS